MSTEQVTVSAEELAELRRIKAAALALALSDPQMCAAMGNEATEDFDPWPEAEALVAALKGSAR